MTAFYSNLLCTYTTCQLLWRDDYSYPPWVCTLGITRESNQWLDTLNNNTFLVGFGPHKPSLTHFLLKCLYQAKKDCGRVFVCYGYRFCLFIRLFHWILELFRQYFFHFISSSNFPAVAVVVEYIVAVRFMVEYTGVHIENNMSHTNFIT